MQRSLPFSQAHCQRSVSLLKRKKADIISFLSPDPQAKCFELNVPISKTHWNRGLHLVGLAKRRQWNFRLATAGLSWPCKCLCKSCSCGNRVVVYHPAGELYQLISASSGFLFLFFAAPEQIQQIQKRFKTIPKILELDHLTVTGDATSPSREPPQWYFSHNEDLLQRPTLSSAEGSRQTARPLLSGDQILRAQDYCNERHWPVLGGPIQVGKSVLRGPPSFFLLSSPLSLLIAFFSTAHLMCIWG